jgi:hypothetical protein
MYRVNWDNCAHACGTFPDRFATYEEADAYGRAWQAEMEAVDPVDPVEDGYSYEVIEEPEP